MTEPFISDEQQAIASRIKDVVSELNSLLEAASREGIEVTLDTPVTTNFIDRGCMSYSPVEVTLKKVLS